MRQLQMDSRPVVFPPSGSRIKESPKEISMFRPCFLTVLALLQGVAFAKDPPDPAALAVANGRWLKIAIPGIGQTF